jgi:hypothetical protein
MAEASNILRDDLIVNRVLYGSTIEPCGSKSSVDFIIKSYIVNAVEKLVLDESEYGKRMILYHKSRVNGMKAEYPGLFSTNHRVNAILLKVNRLRQKYWYWEKLK